MGQNDQRPGNPGAPNNVADLNAKWHGPTVKGPGGSGDGGGGMEQRISAIEKRLDGIDSKLASLATDSAYLKGRIEDMPTKDWMNTKLFQLLAGLSILMAIFTAVAKMI